MHSNGTLLMLIILARTAVTKNCGIRQYLDEGTGQCADCHPNCAVCNGPDYRNCSQCKDGFLFTLSTSSCTATCPDKYYQSGATCNGCSPGCSSCVSSTECTLCSPGWLLENKRCVNACSDGYFQGGTWCVACHEDCASCSGPRADDCLTCKVPKRKMIDKYECTDPCPTGYYDEFPFCKKCHSDCKTCSGPDPTNCTSCRSSSHYMPSRNSCIASCPAGFFSTGTQCLACSDQCKTCYGPNSNNCKSCTAPKRIISDAHMCVVYCPPTGYLATPYACIPCHSSCQTCSGLSSNNCLTCPTGKFFNSFLTVCEDSCGTGYYEDNGVCKKCFQLCKQCTGSATHCTACHGTDLLTPSTAQCVTACHKGFFLNTELNICQPCHSTCGTCSSASQEDCLSCSTTAKLQLDTKQCLESCRPGYYEAAGQCIKCNENCATCYGRSEYQCETCNQGMLRVVQNHNCVATCPDGYYTQASECKKCDPTCATCSGSGINACLSCPSYLTYYQLEKRCYGRCPAGAVKVDGICQTCHHGCAECTGLASSDCIKCRTDDLLVPNQGCLPECAPGYFEIWGECWKCHESCTTCTGSQDYHCLTCKPGLLFETHRGRCLSACEAGTYRSGNTCLQCFGECATCDGPSQMNCLSCIDNYFKMADKKDCVLQCPEGYFPDTRTNPETNKSEMICTNCNSNCKSCDGPEPTDCLGCALDKVYYPSKRTCEDSCVDGTFFKNSACNECHRECATCSGPLSDQCLTCPPGLVLNQQRGYCTDKCAPGEYQESAICMTCHSECQTCSGRDSDNCMSCRTGKFFHQSQCLPECPAGTYGIAGLCLECHNSCLTCNGPNISSCTACAPHLRFNPVLNTCAEQCALGFFAQDRQCQQCDSSCHTCTGPSASQCSSCSAESIYDQITHQCLDSCGERRYNYAGKCKECHSSCAACDGGQANNCLRCAGGLLYLQDFKKCVDACPIGFYEHNGGCLRCHQDCQTCSGLSNRDCLSCRASMRHVPTSNTCVTHCPSRYYQVANLCKPCDYKCEQCTGSLDTQCQKCGSQYFQLEGKTQCVAQCPLFTFPHLSICKICHASCKTCTGVLPADCVVCASGYYMYDSLCKKCPVSLQLLQGDELLAALAQECNLQISEDTEAEDAFEVEVVQKYNEYLVSWGQVAQFQGLVDASSNILMSLSASFFHHDSPKQMQLKKPLGLTSDSDILLDRGYSYGASVRLHIPKESLNSLPNTNELTLLGSLWRQGLFDYENFGDFECPVVALSLAAGGKLIQVNGLPEPIEITFALNGPAPSVSFSGAYWNEVQWDTRGLETRVNGAEITISTRHLSSFSLIVDLVNGQRVTQPEEAELLLHVGCSFLGVFFLLVCFAVMCDVATCKYEWYPHWKELKEWPKSSAPRPIFPTLLRYSLLYNLPFISLYSFRDKALHSWARTLWLGGLFCLVYSLAFLVFYSQTSIAATSSGTVGILAALLSLIFLPNSCLFCMLKRPRSVRAKKASAVVPISPQASPRASDRQLNEEKPDVSGQIDLMEPAVQKKEMVLKTPLRSRLCFLLFLTCLIFMWLSAILLTATTVSAMYYSHSYVYSNALMTTGIAFAVGFAFSILKVLLSAGVSKALRRPGPDTRQALLVQLCVDELTAFVHQDLLTAMREREWMEEGGSQPEPLKIKRFSSGIVRKSDKMKEGVERANVPPIGLTKKQSTLGGVGVGGVGGKKKRPPFI